MPPRSKSEISLRTIARTTRVHENMLMEQFSMLERHIDLVDKLREETSTQSPNHAEKTKAAYLRKAEKDIERNWKRLKTGMLKYLGMKASAKEIGDRVAEVQVHNTSQSSSGDSLLSKLGMAVFAWKTSNAFDDLAKMSGRKK